MELIISIRKTIRKKEARLSVTPTIQLFVVPAGCATAFILVNHLIAPWTHLLNPNKEIGISNFLMMGLNPEFRGAFAQPDVEFSASFPDVSPRTAGNIQVILERLSDHEPFGLLALFGDKLLTNFNDGTFAWGVESFLCLPTNRTSRRPYGIRPFHILSRGCILRSLENVRAVHLDRRAYLLLRRTTRRRNASRKTKRQGPKEPFLRLFPGCFARDFDAHRV